MTDTRLADALTSCDVAAKAIARLEPEQWAGFVLLILETLDNEPGDLTPILDGIKAELEARLETRRW